jgi:CHAT domain-containing protein/Tfp pilus assembly protein PilF
MMKAIALLGLVLLLCTGDATLIFAQNPALPALTDAVSARQMLANAKRFSDSSQYKPAEAQAEHAYKFFHQTPYSEASDLAEAAYQMGRALFGGNRDAIAQGYFEEASKIWDTLYPEGSPRSADALHFVARCLFRQDKTDQALIICTQAYEIRKKLQPSNPCDVSESLRLMGNLHLQLGGYATAKQYYIDALPLATDCAGPESPQVADVLANLGVAFLRLEDFQQSIAIQEKALIIRQKKLPPSSPDIATSYMNIGEIYKKLLKFDDALFYYEKALEIQRKSTSIDHNAVAYAYSEIGQYFMSKNDYSKAKDYFEKENTAMLALKAEKSAAYAYTCADLGHLFLAIKDYPKAIEWHEKMVAVWQQTLKQPDTQLGSMFIILGKSRMINGDFAGAMFDYQKGKQIYESILGPNNTMSYKADLGLANIYRKWYLKDGQDSLLNKCRAHYLLTINGVEAQLSKENAAVGQRKILAESRFIFEQAIGAEMLEFKAHPENLNTLKKAWQISETAHGYMLLAATQEANARHFAGIPDAELQRDSLLRVEITTLEKKRQSLIRNQGLSLTDSLVLALSVQVSEKKEASRQLSTIFEKRYPDYFRLKYERQTASLEKTQQLLTPQQTLLEYFVGDSAIFVFVVQREGSKVLEIPRNFPLNDWVQSFREGISGYHTTTDKTPALYKKTVLQYAESAQKLYEKLLAPIAESLKPELIVVPGDGFTNLPFEALLAAAPKDLTNFNTYPFLLRSHAIQYAYSATMLHQMMARQHRQTTTGGLLAFAPFFEEDTTSLALRLQQDEATRTGFSALPFSGEEVFRAKKRWGGASELRTGKEATKQTFMELAAGYKILHLATHGKANPLAGEFSFLAFASKDESIENGLLSVGELYNLRLNADLVVLSACETGIGEQQRGEGVLSLARAFAFAGAKGIVASMWSVNDKSTMLIMDHFYAGIKSGGSKNTALANAKRQYLEQHPGLPAHPFFWAGFVGVGDMSAIKN